eukprot:scaffold88048_cov69-Phaeocystis_antarctica.AAC.7
MRRGSATFSQRSRRALGTLSDFSRAFSCAFTCRFCSRSSFCSCCSCCLAALAASAAVSGARPKCRATSRRERIRLPSGATKYVSREPAAMPVLRCCEKISKSSTRSAVPPHATRYSASWRRMASACIFGSLKPAMCDMEISALFRLIPVPPPFRRAGRHVAAALRLGVELLEPQEPRLCILVTRVVGRPVVPQGVAVDPAHITRERTLVLAIPFVSQLVAYGPEIDRIRDHEPVVGRLLLGHWLQKPRADRIRCEALQDGSAPLHRASGHDGIVRLLVR